MSNKICYPVFAHLKMHLLLLASLLLYCIYTHVFYFNKNVNEIKVRFIHFF